MLLVQKKILEKIVEHFIKKYCILDTLDDTQISCGKWEQHANSELKRDPGQSDVKEFGI